MAYDYKRLCNELLGYLYQCNWPDGKRFYALVERARAALAEPEQEEPTREESVLSPAAQAVFDAYLNAPCGKPRQSWVAAALRAAVDQVVPVPRLPYDSCCDVHASAIRADFIAIAIELETL